MKIDFSQPIMSLRGIPVRNNALELIVLQEASKLAEREVRDLDEATNILGAAKVLVANLMVQVGPALTLGDCCANVLIARLERRGEESQESKEYYRRLKLAERIWSAEKGETVDVSVEDIVLIKSLIVRTNYTGLVIGRVVELLDPASENEKKK